VYKRQSLYSALSLVSAHKSDDGLWHLPGSQNFVAPVNETAEDDLDDNFDDLATAIDHPVKQDDGGNMQDNGGNTQDAPVNIEDEELNTEAPQVSSPDNESSSPDNGEDTLINPSAGVANPSDIVSIDDLHPDFAALPDHHSSNGQAIETAPVLELNEITEEIAEVSQAKHGFKEGDKVYVGLTSRIGTIVSFISDDMARVRNKYNTVTEYIQRLSLANKENHERLSASFPLIDWQKPPLTGSDLCRLMLQNGWRYVSCFVSNHSDDDALVVSRYQENLRHVTISSYGKNNQAFCDDITEWEYAVPFDQKTGLPLTESGVFGEA
jgi:hypothetical protein